MRRPIVAGSERGETGLIEVAVAFFVTVIVAPTFAIATAFGWQYLLSATAQATVASQSGQLLVSVVQQLSGAQPVGYCPDAPGSLSQPLAMLETYASSCPEPAAGPPPPSGDTSWPSVQLPTPSSACSPAVVTTSALVVATATCVGFYSYGYEPTSTGNADFTPALGSGGPLSPPALTYLWVCTSSCPNGVAADSLWVTYYPSQGTATNPGCPAQSQNGCSSPNWSTSPPRTRFIGALTTASGVLSYQGTSANSLVTPVGAAQLPSIQVVNVNAQLAAPNQVVTSAMSVEVTGNVYQGQSNWEG